MDTDKLIKMSGRRKRILLAIKNCSRHTYQEEYSTIGGVKECRLGLRNGEGLSELLRGEFQRKSPEKEKKVGKKVKIIQP